MYANCFLFVCYFWHDVVFFAIIHSFIFIFYIKRHHNSRSMINSCQDLGKFRTDSFRPFILQISQISIQRSAYIKIIFIENNINMHIRKTSIHFHYKSFCEQCFPTTIKIHKNTNDAILDPIRSITKWRCCIHAARCINPKAFEWHRDLSRWRLAPRERPPSCQHGAACWTFVLLAAAARDGPWLLLAHRRMRHHHRYFARKIILFYDWTIDFLHIY